MTIYIVVLDVSATAAAFVGTTVHQVSLWRTVSNHSNQLPDIYDYILSATATPGGQSFQRRQQQLPKRQQQQQGCHLMNSSTY